MLRNTKKTFKHIKVILRQNTKLFTYLQLFPEMFDPALRSINLEFGHELMKDELVALFCFLTFLAFIKQFHFYGITDSVSQNTNLSRNTGWKSLL